MRIIFLSDDFPPESFGGAGISTYELALGMKKAGHDVFVVTTVREKSRAGEIEYNGLTIFKIASNYHSRWRAYKSIYNARVLHELEDILKKIRPDVVHANNIHYHLSWASLAVAKNYAKAVVFTARDTMAVTYGKLATKKYLTYLNPKVTWFDNVRQAKLRWNPVRNFFIKKYLKNLDKIFTVSNSLRDALLQNGIKNVETMHTGVDIDSWRVSPEEVTIFKTRNNLDGKKVIMFGGRLSEAKGGRKALEAVAQVIKAIPEAVLLVAGSVDRYAQVMREEAERLGVGDKKIIFTGWVQNDEIKLAYSAADVVLVPSLYLDPFPRIVLEAMAAGKPVVGTCFGGAPEVIKEDVTGYIINPFDVGKMAERMIDLLNNPKKSEQFGKRGQERMKLEFNLDTKVNAIIRQYLTLIS